MTTTQLTTNNYRLHMAQQFFESFNEGANNVYYAFAGKTSGFPGGVVPTIYDSVKTTQFDAQNNMLFGKHIQPTDIAYMVNANLWTSGTVYDMYDDQDIALGTKQFYVCVSEGTTYYIYKCLNNNNGAASTDAPTFADTSASDTYYETGDGYQWKYMYQLNSATYLKFSTSLYIPFTEDTDVTDAASPGAVDVIVPVDANGDISAISGSGYGNYYTDTFPSNTAFVNIAGAPYCVIGNSAVSTSHFYEGCYFYISNGAAQGNYGQITSHISNATGTYVYLDRQFATQPDATSTYEITPSVVILNSTNSLTGVEARALVDSATANSIYKVEILARGGNVYSAGAYVLAANQVGVTNTAILRVISGPKGGHGANVTSELFCSRVGLSVKFANSESNTITTYNDYKTVGILKDPMFANVTFTTSNQHGTFTANELVTQTAGSNSAFGYVSQIGVGSIQVTNTSGFFASGYDIVGDSSSANATVDAITNNGVVKGFETFSQLYKYNGTYVTASQFTADEVVYQSNVSVSNAIFHSNNSSGNTVYLTQKLGPIYSSNNIVGQTSGAIFNINTNYEPDLVFESGDVLYLENFDAVNRSSTQTETIKLILEF